MMTLTRPSVSLMHAEGRDGTRRDAKGFLEQIRLAEAEAGCANALVKMLHVDFGVTFSHDQVKAALGILEEQVLGVAAGQLPVEFVGLCDSENGLVFDGGGGNSKFFER